MNLLQKEQSTPVRLEVIKVVQRFPAAVVVESFIIGLLQSPNEAVRADAIKMLQRFNPEIVAKHGLPSVQVLKDATARRIIIESVGKLSSGDMIPLLPQLL